MTAEAVQTEPAAKPLSRWESMKMRAALAAGSGMALVGAASAEIDFTNISSLIQDVVGILPDFMDLIIGVAPLIVTMAIVTFIVSFINKILKWF